MAVNDANLITFDVLYSDFDAKRDENFLEAISFSRNAAQGGKPQTRSSRGELDAERQAGVRPVRRRRHPLRIALRRARHEVHSYTLTGDARAQRALVDERARRLLAVGLQQSDPDHDHARSRQHRRLLVGLPRQRPPAGVQLRLRRRPTRPTGRFGTFRGGSVGNPHCARRASTTPSRSAKIDLQVRRHRRVRAEGRRRLQEVRVRDLRIAPRVGNHRARAAGRHDARRPDARC